MKELERFKDLDNLFKVLKHVIDNSVGLGVNLKVLTKFYMNNLLHLDPRDPKEFNKYYMRLYRFFMTLNKNGLIDINKADGLVWVKAKNETIDLIFNARKTQTSMVRRKRVNEFKFTAKRFLGSKRVLVESDYEFLYSLFDEYLDRTGRKVLVFKGPDGLVVKRYSHRFTRRGIRVLYERFKRVFEEASKRFQYGVFLTLTMDPKTYSSIEEGVKKRSEAWNRFMSFLSKRVGFRPRYISVLEFQDSGNPHLHVVLFGISGIMDHFELTEYLKRHGFGEIHFEYKIVNHGGKWIWAKGSGPTGSGGQSGSPKPSNGDVEKYLEKYLAKALGLSRGLSEKSDGSQPNIGVQSNQSSLDEFKITLYWGLDARFFTYSRDLNPVLVQHSREFGWVYIGSYDVYNAPDWLYPYVAELYPELGPPLIIRSVI